MSAPIDTPTLSPFPTLPLARSLDRNNIGAEGAIALAAILNETNITNLECDPRPPKCLLLCQRPLTRPSCPSALTVSQATNSEPRAPLCSLPSSARRRSPTSCAPPLPSTRLLSCQRPLTHLRTLPPFLARASLASISEHISYLGPSPSLPPSLLHRLPHSHPRDAALDRAPRRPRSRPPVGRVGRACSRAHLTPLRPSRHRLKWNSLNDEAKQAVKDAAGSGVSITF